MPLYKDAPCVGMCESFNKQCLRPELYAEVAEKYGAEPFENSGTMVTDPYGPEVPWSQWALNVQGESREDAILAIMDTVKDRDKVIKWNDLELRRLTERHWLAELPCHTECPITICGHCTYQHRRDLIGNGTCKVREAMDMEVLPITADLMPEDLEDLQPVYVDPRWPTEESENGDNKDDE